MQLNSPARRIRFAHRPVVFLCLILFLVTATAQVLHFHPDPLAGTAKHCPLCPVLHSVAPITHSVQLDFSFRTTAYLPNASDFDHHGTEGSFALFSRPPPCHV